MWLPARLRGFLESLESHQKLVVDLGELREKIEALEALQLSREVQWSEARDQIYRHLKRANAIKQHQDKQDEAESGRPSQATVLAMKYGKGGS